MTTTVKVEERVLIVLDLGDRVGQMVWTGDVSVQEARNVIMRLRDAADRIEHALDRRMIDFTQKDVR